MSTKEFLIEDVVSMTSGILMLKKCWDGMIQIAEHISGEEGVMRMALAENGVRDAIFEQCPNLESINVKAQQSQQYYIDFIKNLQNKFGSRISLKGSTRTVSELCD